MLTKMTIWRRLAAAAVFSVLTLLALTATALAAGSSNPADASAWKVGQMAGAPVVGYTQQACAPNSKFCVAFGGEDAYTYTDGRWGKPVIVDLNRSIVSSSCATSRFCMLADSEGDAVRYDGSKWGRPVRVVSGKDGLSAVACTSSQFCMAVTKDGGVVVYRGTRGWGKTVDLGVGQGACASSSLCVASGASGLRSFNGLSWSAASNPSTGSIDSVACAPGGAKCFAIDSNGYLLTYTAKRGWNTPQLIDNVVLSQITCLNDSSCYALARGETTRGEADFIIKQTRGRWGPASIVPEIAGLTCASSTLCLTAEDGEPVVYNGTQFGTANVLGRDDYSDAISCASAGHCVVTAAAGRNEYRQDGSSWRAIASPGIANASGGLHAISCATANWCMASTSGGEADTYASGKWGHSLRMAESSNDSVVSMSCPSATFCLAVGGDQQAQGEDYTYGNGTWSSAQLPAARLLNAVSCTSNSFCLALGTSNSDSDAYTYSGGSWAPGVVLGASGLGLDSVSCTSTTFCAAVGSGGIAYVFDGHSWKHSDPDPGHQPTSVSCASSTRCVAVDSAGRVFSYNGKSWSTPVTIDREGALTQVSCPSESYCVALEGTAENNIVTFDHPS